MVTGRFPEASAPFVVQRFLRLLERGWDVHVATRRSKDEHRAAFPALLARPDALARIHTGRDLAGVVEALSPRLVHVELANLSSEECVLAGGEARLLVGFGGFDAGYAGLVEPGYYGAVWCRADAYHFVADGVRRLALARGCPPGVPHAVIPPGVDPAWFDPGSRRHRAVAGTRRRPLRVLTVARIRWEEGLEYALAAVHRVIDAGARCEHRILGEASAAELDRLLFTVGDLRLLDFVTPVRGRTQADVRRQLGWADVLLQAAVLEDCAATAAEAQAMRVPVVCADAAGMDEVVSHGESGFVVPRRDAAALAECLHRLVDPLVRERLGRAGRSRVRVLFVPDRAIEGFERLYRELLAC